MKNDKTKRIRNIYIFAKVKALTSQLKIKYRNMNLIKML